MSALTKLSYKIITMVIKVFQSTQFFAGYMLRGYRLMVGDVACIIGRDEVKRGFNNVHIKGI